MKLEKKELMKKISDLIEDDETKMSVLEDLEDSIEISEEKEETEKVEKTEYDDLKTKYDDLKQKYIERFTKGEEVEKESTE